MRLTLRDDARDYLLNLIEALATTRGAPKEARKPMKMLKRRLQGDRITFRLGEKDVAYLDKLIQMGETVLQGRDDQEAQNIRTVLNYIKQAILNAA